MSEEDKEPKPIKLSLAGKRRADENKDGNTSAAKLRDEGVEAEKAPEPQAPEATLKPKLKPRPEPEENTISPEFDDVDSAPEAESPPRTKLKPKLKPRPDPEEQVDFSKSDVAESAPEASEPPSEAASIPMEDAPEPEPEAEPEKPAAAAPPPLPVRPVPTPDDALEQALDRVSKGEKSSSSPLLSIVIIFALLGILGGSGYGLWYVLKGSSGGEVDETMADESSEGFLGAPINKAKEAISALPQEELEEVTSSDSIDSTATSPPPSELVEAPVVPPTNPVAPAPSTPQVSGVSQELVQAVANYLGEVHIGGVRTGERPMVIINGASYSKGDLVEPETGLLFSGIRNGKLAFTDENGVVYLKSF